MSLKTLRFCAKTKKREEFSSRFLLFNSLPLKSCQKWQLFGKDDVMVEIRPIGDKNKYIINRGAAIEKDDNLIVQDIKPNTDLFDNTGTSGNFGMTKMIHKHGLTKQEVKKIPKLLREYKTTGIRPENNTYQWRVPLDSKDDFIFSFAPKEKHVLKRNILKEITIHKKRVGKNKDIPLSQKK